MRSRRKLLPAVGALTLLMVVGACGSSSHSSSTPTTKAAGSSGSATTATSGSGASTTAAPIKVGLMCTCSGPFGTDTVSVADVYKAWVDSTNAAGGINGHQIKLYYEDDAGTPGTSVTELESLVADHVDAIADMSIVDETWASKVQAAGIPVVGMDATEIPFYENPDFYPEGQTEDSVTQAIIATAKAAGATNLGDMYCAEAASCAEGVPLIKAAGQKAGIPAIYNAEIAYTAPNYTAQCVAAQQDHVQAVFIGDSPQVFARVGADCARQGYTPTYIEEGEGFSNLLTPVPGLKDKLWMEFNDLPFYASTSNVQAMNAALDKYYPGLRNNSNTFSALAGYAWPSGILLQDAVKAGGLTASQTPSSSEIVTGLDSLKGDNLDGWAPPLTFTAGQPHPVDCWFTGRVQNGVASLANNGQVTCENGSSS